MVNKKTKYIGILIFFAIYLLTRFPSIGTTIVNTDEVYWQSRSSNFLNAIKTRNYSATYQKYHPGVSLMWDFSIMSLIISAFTEMSPSQVFNNFNFIHTGTQVFLVLWFLVLSILLIFTLYKILEKWWLSIFAVILLTLEPFYTGNCRLIHLDAQISYCVLLSLALIYLYIFKERRIWYLVFGTFFIAVAALNKSLFLGTLLYCLFVGALLICVKNGFKRSLKYFLTTILMFLLFYFSLFPSMWVSPGKTIKRMFTDSYQTGIEEGHNQVFFGQDTKNPGFTFYPILIFMKTSPFMLIGIIFFLSSVILDSYRNIKFKEKHSLKNIPFILFISVFYIGYFCGISYFNKKIDRYIVSLYPYFALISAVGWFRVRKIKTLILPGTAIFLCTTIYPLYTLFPHYLMYVNPMIGDSKDANGIVGQKMFGIGIFELKNYISDKYGETATLGLNDTVFRSLRSIYPRGKVYNLLFTHPRKFDIMVLGPGKNYFRIFEDYPKHKFYYVDSIYIDGLEFWRIYEKEKNK